MHVYDKIEITALHCSCDPRQSLWNEQKCMKACMAFNSMIIIYTCKNSIIHFSVRLFATEIVDWNIRKLDQTLHTNN